MRYSLNFYKVVMSMLTNSPIHRLHPYELDEIIWSSEKLHKFLNNKLQLKIPEEVLSTRKTNIRNDAYISKSYPVEPVNKNSVLKSPRRTRV